MRKSNRFVAVISAPLLISMIGGCKSYWIDASVENHTGQAIHELEVDYPTASFGNNGLADSGVMHYRFQVRGDGPVRVEYTGTDGKKIQSEGLMLSEHEQGQIVIRLLPQGKVQFVPNVKPAA